MSEISFTVVTHGGSEHALPFKMDGTTTIELLKTIVETQVREQRDTARGPPRRAARLRRVHRASCVTRMMILAEAE